MNKEKIKIVLVDDHEVVRDGIKAILESDNEISVIATADSYESLKPILLTQKPDILILDISLPEISGIEIAKIITRAYPEIKVIMLSMYLSEDFIFNSIKAGAKSYLPKNSSKNELLKTIHEVNRSNDYFPDEVSAIILKGYLKKIKTEEKTVDLTKRENELLSLFAKGLTNKEISDQLFISIRTVETHKNHIMNKLDIKSSYDLLKYALKHNIIEI
ncbi:MAG: response regulator transcription factor [bacterium]